MGPECQLNVGDRILEVNGKPVCDHPLPDLEKVLNHRTDVVQVNKILNANRIGFRQLKSNMGNVEPNAFNSQ